MAAKKGIHESVLKNIRNAIPYGALREIHKRHTELMKSKGKEPLEYHSITAVIRGDWYREEVIDIAIQWIEEEKEKNKEANKVTSARIKAALS